MRMSCEEWVNKHLDKYFPHTTCSYWSSYTFFNILIRIKDKTPPNNSQDTKYALLAEPSYQLTLQKLHKIPQWQIRGMAGTYALHGNYGITLVMTGWS